ncbi:MAG TPA: hypothetical protein VE086_00595 [Chthoniobacterales bacterium]|nr:hypothetical protein [Chthoniobacterales bacterium]
MRNIEIDLAEPFEKILATVLSLPSGRSDVVSDRLTNEAELALVIRRLYEAANGRQVETKIGFIPIAPPVFDVLKEKPFRVGTQTELLIEAAARLIKGPVSENGRDEVTQTIDDPRSSKTSMRQVPIHRPTMPLFLNATVPL